MKFNRSINTNGWMNVGQPGFRQMYKYGCSDDLFEAELFQIFHPGDRWDFIVRLAPDGLKKELFNSIENGTACKTLKEAKQTVEKIIGLLHRANSNNELWIAKGIMLGFTDVNQMEHLKSTE